MEETFKFLKENTKVNFVSTINGDKDHLEIQSYLIIKYM